MAKYNRRDDLVQNTFAFKMFGKRLCDLNDYEKKEYFRQRKQFSRNKDTIREKERIYREIYWNKKRR